MFLKRAVDLLGAAIALGLAAPVMAVTAVSVLVAMGRPVLFRQLRAGYQGKPFTLLKFRTMREATGPDGRPLPDGQRLTCFGRLLRRASLDELPQLLNVLRGEMSLVGPRPLLLCYLDRYTTRQARRHEVKPGLTGWAQVHGRNALSWEEKFELDVWYVEHQSVAMDLQILCRTLWMAARREGISHAGDATMPEFIGVDAANDPYSIANAAVPAEFAKQLAVGRFVGSAGHDRGSG